MMKRCGLWMQFASLFYLFVVFGACAQAGTPDPAYIEACVVKARQQDLAGAPEWHALLHYEKSLWGYRSPIDDPAFFLHPRGKSDPAAELEATLRAFFQPVGNSETAHPVCKFVARFHWLDQVLQFDRNQLPVPECESYERVRSVLKPASATLIFPSAYLNGPASMFGHTLLVFDATDQNRLLAKGLNYAARTDTSFGPAFAFKGIFGLDKGYYGVESYYDKVEQYNDISHRDIWEYELDFNPDEVNQMFRHAWELQNIYSDYFFLTENCSYNLLYLLQVARPSLKLTEAFSFNVIPLDTVKLIRKQGLVRQVNYRPSKTSRLRHMADRLDPVALHTALSIARGEQAPDDVPVTIEGAERQRRVLDLAAEHVQYQYTTETLAPEAYRKRFLNTLKIRSKLGQADTPDTPEAALKQPDSGHDPHRIAIGAGMQNAEGFAEIKWRLAYHALVDYPAGFEPGAHMQFLHTSARYLFEQDQFRLERLDVIEIQSFAPRDNLFRPFSWKVGSGVEQNPAGSGGDHLAGYLDLGRGVAFGLPGGSLAFATLDADVLVDDRYRDDMAFGPGASAGLVAQVSDGWNFVLQLDTTWYGLGEDFWEYRAAWEHNLLQRGGHSARLTAAHFTRDRVHLNEVSASWNVHF